ncbi:hypothetical protein FA13DRAFT_1724550, partial [Coprinellus micaceus]
MQAGLYEDGDLRAETQLIAKAIAVYDHNRRLSHGQVQQTFVPAILFRGSALFFYKNPMTDELRNAVTIGTPVTRPITIQRFRPPVSVPWPGSYETDGHDRSGESEEDDPGSSGYEGTRMQL